MKAMKQSSVKNRQGPGLLLLCSRVSLGKAAGSEPHLTSFIAEFSDCPTGLLHCFCLSLGLMSQSKYTKGSLESLNVRTKLVLLRRQHRAGTWPAEPPPCSIPRPSWTEPGLGRARTRPCRAGSRTSPSRSLRVTWATVRQV